MAVDTRDKRASVLGLAVATFALVLPNPDGAALSQADRQQTAFCYAGIEASAVEISDEDLFAGPDDPVYFAGPGDELYFRGPN